MDHTGHAAPSALTNNGEGAVARFSEGQTTQQSWAVAGMRLEAVCGNSDPLQLNQADYNRRFRKLLTAPSPCYVQHTGAPVLFLGEGPKSREDS